jgi:hypothetical protein
VTSLPEKSPGFIPSKAERSKEKNGMSEIFLKLTIANIKDPQRQKEISFLVDTGATRAWISQEIAEAVGIEKTGTVPLELAVADPAYGGNGSVKELPYGLCLFIYDGEMVAGNVVIGPLQCEPLVGTHVLQDFRVIVDLEKHEIIRGQTMRAK